MKKRSNIIFGRHPVIEAIQSGKTIDKVIMQQGFKGPLEIEIRHLCKDNEILEQLPVRQK